MKKKALNADEKIAWLQLARTEQVGPITFRQLIQRYGTPQAALEAIPELAKRGGRLKALTAPPVKKIQDEISRLEDIGGTLIALCEPDYPEALAAIDDAPPVLTVRGHKELLHKQSIGIVGARNASLNGRKMAERLAADLGARDYVIASGLARGIDTAAHQAALGTGTVAALAGGVDVVYPEENRKLYEQIVEQGCVIAEQPVGTEPSANLFPRRNRLISGLSLGVIVVEAAKQSGSLITARMALEQGREVFAVPGSPLDPRANGTNDLIRQGAILTERAEDVFEHLNRPSRHLAEPHTPTFDEPFFAPDETDLAAGREIILENLSTSPVPVDELVRRCQLSLPLVLTVLLELELAGRLERQAGNHVSLIG